MTTSAVRRRGVQRRQREQTRGRIVAAAEEMLRDTRVRDLSVEEVMERAGLTRTIFYRHFDDVFDLVLSVAAGSFEELYAGHLRMFEELPHDGASLREALRAGVAVFAEHGPLIRAVAESAAVDEEVERVYQAVLERFVTLTAALLRERADVTDATETARALTLLNVGYLLDAFGRGARISAAEAERTVVELWERVIPMS